MSFRSTLVEHRKDILANPTMLYRSVLTGVRTYVPTVSTNITVNRSFWSENANFEETEREGKKSSINFLEVSRKYLMQLICRRILHSLLGTSMFL